MERETRRLTYADLAASLAIDRESARRRATRSGWPRVPGNGREVLVEVPLSELPEAGAAAAADAPAAPPAPSLAESLDRLSRALEAAQAQGAVWLRERDEARARAGSAEAEAAARAAEADVLRRAAAARFDARLKVWLARMVSAAGRRLPGERGRPLWPGLRPPRPSSTRSAAPPSAPAAARPPGSARES